jgi:type II secretory ATPase GspE/PulE/Tfp pilus assembly ATPase PilB-like protein
MSAKLEDRLLSEGLVSAGELARAQEESRRSLKPLATVLIETGRVAEAKMLRVLADRHGLEFVRLEDTLPDETAAEAVSAKLAAHYAIMPVRLEAGILTIAVSNPYDMAAVEDIETNLGYQVERVLACRGDILAALRRVYGVGADTVERILAQAPSRPGVVELEESHDLEKMAEDASVVKLVNQLLQEAINDRATDIHMEVYREGVTVRRRIDGVLYDVTVPGNIRLLFPAIVSRVKLMSGLDIVERRLPQDGRARVRIGRREYDLRISIVPAVHGEDIVIRILPAAMLFDLGDLGFSESHLAILKDLIARPHGILFVTGPTGSGKSTTLYACLNKLNTRDRKIITIEDPVEYEMRGITQTQIRPGIGLTFARALRSMLRHDPDVMMVGEVRDRETAEIAVQTAMTGHLVLSTLHTNDAAGAAVRLIDMGIDPYLIASTVLAFSAQRLVRVICPDCRESVETDGRTAYRGRGCPACSHRGYRGRVAISEFIPLVSEIQDLILKKASAQAVRRQADTLGMRSLAADGWDKVAKGLTTAEEVLRVTNL